MVKKILAIFLSIMLVLGFCFTGCGPDGADNAEGTNPGDVSELPSGEDGEGDKEDEEDIVLENADILAISYDRLENADLSFNFSLDVSAKEIKSYSSAGVSERKMNAFNASEVSERSSDCELNIEREIYELNDFVSYREKHKHNLEYNYFDEQQTMLEELSETARDTVDFAIENITVANTLVDAGLYKYILSYDREEDKVTVYESVNYGSYTEYIKISVFNDDDGDEAVTMTRINQGSLEDIVYVPGKYYSVKSGDKDNNMYNVSVAYNENGLWRGVRYSFDPDNTFLTKDGVYDYGNGMIYVEFLFETEGGIYTFSDQLVAFRDGGETATGIEALPDDEIVLRANVLSGNGVYIDFAHNIMDADLLFLDGCKKLRYVLDTESELANINYEKYTAGDGDYIEFTNGTRLNGGDIWSEDTGIIHQVWEYLGEDGNHYWGKNGYVDDNGNPVVNIPDENFVELLYVKSYLDVESGEVGSGFVTLSVNDIGSDESLAMLNDYFRFLGVSVYGYPDIFSDMSDIQNNRSAYTDDIFEHLYKTEYDVDNYILTLFDTAEEINALYASIPAEMQAESVVKIEDMPQKPADIGLINLREAISGKAVISGNGINYSGITVSVNKSVILSEGKQYGIFVSWVSAEGYSLSDAFEKTAYAFEKMTFNGKDNVALPSIAKEGEYVLQAFFCKYDGDSVLRLSEIIPVSAEDFEPFSVDVPAEGGYFRHEFNISDGSVSVAVTFVDTGMPAVFYNNEEIEGRKEITVSEGVIVSEFSSGFYVFDDYDGEIAVSAGNFTRGGVVLTADDIITEGEYLLTVSDKTGNKTSVTLVVSVSP